MKNKILLITGANGHLARFLVEKLKETEAKIFGLIHHHCTEELSNHYHGIYSDFQQLKYDLEHVDYVFHLASIIPYKKENIPNPDYIENIRLTCELAKKYSDARWIYSSSVSVYGHNPEEVWNIDSGIYNPNLYGLSKLASEAIIRNLNNYAIIRFSSLIGPKVWTPTFVPTIIQKAKKEKIIKIFGTGKRKQNYLDYRDAASLLIRCAECADSFSGLGCSLISYSNYEIAKIVSEICDAKIELVGTDESRSFIYDNSSFFEKIDFQPSYSIRQTIKDMVDNV